MYTHLIKRSNQLCFHAAWWPSKDPHAGSTEKAYPLMMLESGQCTRVRADNLQRLSSG